MIIFDRIIGKFSTDMGIDLGTATSLVCVRGQGIVLCEPSVVAIEKTTGRVVAVGDAAKKMIGKTPGWIIAVRPMKSGVIADFDVTREMISYFIEKVHQRKGPIHPRIVIAVPSGITAVERRAVITSALNARAREVRLVKEPMAAAIGAGLPVEEPNGSMIVDIGGGTTEVAVISLADIACSESLRVAGDVMDEAIIAHMKKTYSLLVGEQTAERIKIEIGSAHPLEQELTMDVSGRDLIAGLPRKTSITSEEIREALREPILQIIEAVKRTLERTEPELSADLVHNGIVMAGGGSMLRGLSTVMAQATGLTVKVADDPLTCVARGTAVFLENEAWWQHSDGEDEGL